jgi:hypothetical protein
MENGKKIQRMLLVSNVLEVSDLARRNHLGVPKVEI